MRLPASVIPSHDRGRTFRLRRRIMRLSPGASSIRSWNRPGSSAVQVVPHATTVAFLVNPDSVTADPKLREMENAARLLDWRSRRLL
jgi:hypothetical protein